MQGLLLTASAISHSAHCLLHDLDICAHVLHHTVSKTFVVQMVADLQLLSLRASAVDSDASSALPANQ